MSEKFEIIKYTIKIEGVDDVVDVPIAGVKEVVAKIPEGVNYVTTVHFKVNAKLENFKYNQVVTKGGIPLKKREVELGNFEPSEEIQTFAFPQDTTPSGFFFRGKFPAQSTYSVDGKVEYTVDWTVEVTSK